MNNAYKYTDTGRIDLTLDVTRETVKIVVEDTGQGIEKKHQENIFDAYYRVNPEANEGQGLGLYIVKNNVEALDGQIDVMSTVNKGTTITIKLPKKSMA